MRYIITALLLIASALPLAAQIPEASDGRDEENAEITALKVQTRLLLHRIQKARAAESFKSLSLDSLLIKQGYSISADTLDQGYVVLTIPDSLLRETKLVLREWGKRGLPFKKTSEANVIRMGRLTLPLAVEALTK